MPEIIDSSKQNKAPKEAQTEQELAPKDKPSFTYTISENGEHLLDTESINDNAMILALVYSIVTEMEETHGEISSSVYKALSQAIANESLNMAGSAWVGTGGPWGQQAGFKDNEFPKLTQDQQELLNRAIEIAKKLYKDKASVKR